MLEATLAGIAVHKGNALTIAIIKTTYRGKRAFEDTRVNTKNVKQPSRRERNPSLEERN